MEINGYPNYLIYEDSRVYSKRRKIFMKPYLINKGYKCIYLFNNSKRKQFLIHRLVALHYIPNPNNYETVDHIDRNPLNNNISNLRWATMSMQIDNRDVISNTGEKYIHKSKYLYEIVKNKCFRESLMCKKFTLDDAINLRDSLLSIDS
jgi:hypothetical protein